MTTIRFTRLTNDARGGYSTLVHYGHGFEIEITKIILPQDTDHGRAVYAVRLTDDYHTELEYDTTTSLADARRLATDWATDRAKTTSPTGPDIESQNLVEAYRLARAASYQALEVRISVECSDGTPNVLTLTVTYRGAHQPFRCGTVSLQQKPVDFQDKFNYWVSSYVKQVRAEYLRTLL